MGEHTAHDIPTVGHPVYMATNPTLCNIRDIQTKYHISSALMCRLSCLWQYNIILICDDIQESTNTASIVHNICVAHGCDIEIQYISSQVLSRAGYSIDLPSLKEITNLISQICSKPRKLRKKTCVLISTHLEISDPSEIDIHNFKRELTILSHELNVHTFITTCTNNAHVAVTVNRLSRVLHQFYVPPNFITECARQHKIYPRFIYTHGTHIAKHILSPLCSQPKTNYSCKIL
jgi:hypothetical protein